MLLLPARLPGLERPLQFPDFFFGQITEFTGLETRFKMLEKSHPDRARELGKLAQEDVNVRWKLYEHLAQRENDGNGTPGQEKKEIPKPAGVPAE